jgi:tetratricopeptide (TPR) repeat protein
MAENTEQEVKFEEVAGSKVGAVDKYKNVIIGLVGAVTLAAAGYFFYQYQLEESNKEAQNEIYPAVYYFEQDSLDKALKGNGKTLGMLDVADKYAGTKTGKLASFYAGVIYLKQGKFEDAVTYLKQFSSNDYLLQARAYALTGDAYLELDNKDEAIAYYQKAVDYKANEQFTPTYMMKLALALELAGDNAKAAQVYDNIITKYPKSPELNEAKKLKARVETLVTE